MELQVLFLTVLVAASNAIIVSNPAPLTYTLSTGYASQFPLFSHDPSTIFKYANGEIGAPQRVSHLHKDSPGGQYSHKAPTVHHPAEYTFASPPVRHAEPINYPVPPAPVRENVREGPIPTAAPIFASYATQYEFPAGVAPAASLLGVSYSPANAVSSMSYTNGYGVSYGY